MQAQQDLSCIAMRSQLLISAACAEQVSIQGIDGDLDEELRGVVQKSLGLKPNFAYTTREVQREMQRVFQTGFFEVVEPQATDTRDGIALIVKVGL